MSDVIKINFDDGYKTLEINQTGRTIRFNPTDPGFLKRISLFDEKANEIMEKYKSIDMNKISQLQSIDPDNPDFHKFKAAAENVDMLEKAIRELIDSIFGYEICDVVFGEESCLSPANGQPVYLNFIQAIAAYMEKVSEEERRKSHKKLSAYSKKRNALRLSK